jgi:thiamine-monophosphate kinase
MSLGEFELIAQLLRPLSLGYPGALELADDAALVDIPAGRQLVVAKDAMVEGVHFLADDPPASVGRKLLRVNLSDLAAMGAEPLGYLTALARPARIDDRWLRELVAGLAADQARFGLFLLGGDTTSTPGPLTLSLTILGTVPTGAALLRQGALPGDDIWVSGTLGDAALGLRILKGLAVPDEEGLVLIDRYRTPRPRLALGQALRGIAHAAIDISDGLVADLGHVLDCSGVGAEIEAAGVPLSAEARGVPRALLGALTGGDDYELLFAAPAEAAASVAAIGERVAVPLTRIGRITAEPGLRVLDAEGRPMSLQKPGWRHF